MYGERSLKKTLLFKVVVDGGGVGVGDPVGGAVEVVTV